jgi:hypothetical protein
MRVAQENKECDLVSTITPTEFQHLQTARGDERRPLCLDVVSRVLTVSVGTQLSVEGVD